MSLIVAVVVVLAFVLSVGAAVLISTSRAAALPRASVVDPRALMVQRPRRAAAGADRGRM